MTEVEVILKYELAGVSEITEKPTYNFEFPQEIYVVLE